MPRKPTATKPTTSTKSAKKPTLAVRNHATPTAAKASNATKATKASNATKVTKTKVTKAAKVTNPAKTTKVTNAAKATKVTKPIKVAEAAKPAKPRQPSYRSSVQSALLDGVHYRNRFDAMSLQAICKAVAAQPKVAGNPLTVRPYVLRQLKAGAEDGHYVKVKASWRLAPEVRHALLAQ